MSLLEWFLFYLLWSWLDAPEHAESETEDLALTLDITFDEVECPHIKECE